MSISAVSGRCLNWEKVQRNKYVQWFVEHAMPLWSDSAHQIYETWKTKISAPQKDLKTLWSISLLKLPNTYRHMYLLSNEGSMTEYYWIRGLEKLDIKYPFDTLGRKIGLWKPNNLHSCGTIADILEQDKDSCGHGFESSRWRRVWDLREEISHVKMWTMRQRIGISFIWLV